MVAERAESGPLALDGVIAALATRQHGVIAREQLRRLGLSDSAVSRRVPTGRLHPVTSPAWTLLDLAAVLERRALERALDQAEIQRRLPLPAAPPHRRDR